MIFLDATPAEPASFTFWFLTELFFAIVVAVLLYIFLVKNLRLILHQRMKKRINQFVRAYFYFSTHEQKGIKELLLLVLIVWVGYWAYRFTLPNKLQEVQLVLLNEKIKQLELAQTNSRDKLNQMGLGRTKPNIIYERRTIAYPNSRENNLVKKPALAFDINSADSESLEKLSGIGPYLAGKIVSYREKLGGFYSWNQLNEVFGFKEDVRFHWPVGVYLDTLNYQKLNVNTVSFEQLSKHPYFKFSLSRAIINYRKQHGNFKNLQELKKIKILNDSLLGVISPYLTFENH